MLASGGAAGANLAKNQRFPHLCLSRSDVNVMQRANSSVNALESGVLFSFEVYFT